MKSILLALSLLSTFYSFSQDNMTAYKKHVKTADSLYSTKHFAESAEQYHKAFSYLAGKAYPNDRYNAACSYSLANEVDSAFKHLNSLAFRQDYSNYNHIMVDPDLNNLKEDKRWNEFVEQVKVNKSEKEKDYDMELVNILDEVYQTDQGIRMGIRDTMAKYEKGSKALNKFYAKWREVDSINTLKVTQILDKHGWLGSDIIGSSGNRTLFLVIQHADITVQEKYLPMMREAVKNKKASGSSLALLEDRVALRQGKKQIYGSQIASNSKSGEPVVQPLIDPLNVDERRKSVGLGPISEYALRFGIVWDLNQYIKDLPELEKEFGIKE